MKMLEKMRKENPIIKAVAYMRYSSDNQREESIDAQLRAINDYADKNNIVIVGEYADRAKTATTDQRPDFLRMISDAADRDFRLVLVHKLDRFARNRYDSIGYRMELKRCNVSLISVLENLDSENPESIILESVLEGMNEYYSKNLAREVHKGLKENALKGLHTGGSPPLGYDVNSETKKLVINEYEAESIKLIFERTLQFYGYGQIINELNAKGYKTKRGGSFTKNSLNSILKNEKYTGIYVFNKSSAKDIDGKRNGNKYKDKEEIIRVKNAVPQIISNEDFAEVQTRLSKRKQTQKHSRSIETYLLRGKMICGKCGGSYVGTRRRRGNKFMWVSYGCNKRYRTHSIECKNKEINKTFIEGSVLEKLSEYVFNDKYIPYITDEYNNYLKKKNSTFVSEMQGYRIKLKEVNGNVDSLVNLLMKTQSQALLDKLNDFEKEKVQIEGRIETLIRNNKQTKVTQEEIKKEFQKIRLKLSSGDINELKQIIEMYITKIVVYYDYVEVLFNFYPKISDCAV